LYPIVNYYFLKKSVLLLLLLLLSFGFLHLARAESAFQVSLTPEIALVEPGLPVHGLALNIWGDNQVRGLNLGFVNQQSGDSVGFTWSLLGGTVENYRGILFGGLFTPSTGEVIGWQAAAINLNEGSMKGLQTGLFNYSQDLSGLQLGIVNYVNEMHGVQIGLVNIIEENPWFDDSRRS